MAAQDGSYLPRNLTLVLLLLTTSSGTAQPSFKVSYHLDEILVNNSSHSWNSSNCAEAIREVLNRTTIGELYLDAIGRPQSGVKGGNFDWLGSYSECTKLIPDSHYCLAYVEVLNATIGWGLCLPQKCSEDDVTHALQDVFTILRNRNITNVHLSPQPAGDFLGNEQSKAVYCAKPSQYTTGVIVTLTLCGFILFLCLLGTTMDIIVDFRKAPSGSVNKTEGFMPVRHDSVATNNVRFPYFASDDGESNNLTHSCPDRRDDFSHLLQSLNSPTSKPNVLVQFFLCFSLVKNTNRIMDTKIPPGAITSINGMRVLSMWWVILGHTYDTRLAFGTVSNLFLLGQLLQRFTFVTVDNATFSVDSFFFLSGLLVSYLSLREMEKKHGRFPLFKFYFHRFWRLTPTYMFVLLFFVKLTGFLGEGPFWYELQVDPACDKYWWTNLLYINNFYPTAFQDSCMPWAWYLANDMQFFIISPIIVYVAYRFRLWGLGTITGVLLCGSFITTAVLFYHYDLVVQMFGNQEGKNPPKVDFDSVVYVKPYCRIAPYLAGVVLGYVLHMNIRKIRMVYIFNVIGWCIAIVLGLSTLYGVYKIVKKHDHKPFNRAENITYGTFSRFAWSLALAWVIYACHRGLGGLVNSILSARFWIPLSRLTYCAYLVHPIAIITLFGSYETVQAYSDVHIAFTFVGLVGMSYLAAFIVSVCVEYPMMQLEKLIFKTNR